MSFEGPYAVPVAAIRQGLQEAGFVEGQNLAIEYRTAYGEYERLPELAADLVRGQAAVIIAIGASTLALAATAAASTRCCPGPSDRAPAPRGGRARLDTPADPSSFEAVA